MPSDQLAWWEYRTYLLGFAVLQTCSHGHSVSTGTRGDRGTSEETESHGDCRDLRRSPGCADGETEDQRAEDSLTAAQQVTVEPARTVCWPVPLDACHL